MIRQLSILKQLALAAILLAMAGALWFGQDYAGKVFAALPGAGGGYGGQSGQGGHGGGGASGGEKVPVVVERVSSLDNDTTIEAIATARASRSVTLFAEAGGEITELTARAGDRVGKGDVIMRLDSRAAKLAVELAEVAVLEAERKLAREDQLRRGKINSQPNVEDARTALERTRLELRQARETLADRTIKAPFAGIVGIPSVETGDRVTTTTEIVTIDDRGDLLVEIDIPEVFLARIERGQTVTARTPSYPDREFEGRVDEIDSRVDPTARNVMIRAKVPNQADLLRPGMSFAVELAIPGKSYPAVPELALQWNKQQSFVWRVKNGVVEKVEVRSVRRLNSIILVDGELTPGDLVVVEGVQRVRDGRAVSVSERNAPASS